MVECQNQEPALYFLVSTKGHFKIGFSKDVSARALQVMRGDLVRSISWAAYFKETKRAQECEKSLHKLFSQYRIPALPGDGGTEFFQMDCFEQVRKLVKNGQATFGYNRLVLNGEEFLSEEICTPAVTTAEFPQRLKRRRGGSGKEQRLLGSSVDVELYLAANKASQNLDRPMWDLNTEAWTDLLNKYGMRQ